MVGSMRGWRRMFHTTLDKVICVDEHIFHLIKQQFLPFSLNYHYLYVATSPGGCSVASCVGLASRLKKVSTRVESRNRLPHIERNCGLLVMVMMVLPHQSAVYKMKDDLTCSFRKPGTRISVLCSEAK